MTDSRRYVTFVRQRNRALEGIFQMYLAKTSDVVRELERQTVEVAAFWARRGMPALDGRLTPRFGEAAQKTFSLTLHMRKTAYALAHVSECEAMGRATGFPHKPFVSAALVTAKLRAPSPAGGDLHARFVMYFHRLLAKVEDSIRHSILLEEKPEELEARIQKAFPPKRVVRPATTRIGKAMREASRFDTPRPKGTEMSFDFVDDATWNGVVQDYLDAFGGGDRGYGDQVADAWVIGDDGKPREMYDWEAQHDITEDFVQNVRDGQVEAAAANGYTDMSWLSIIDNSTDDCCVDRDGLTTTEIQEKQDSGELEPTQTGGLTPRAHHKCRCDVAPATDNLPDVEPPELGDFSEWLM